MKRHNLLHLSNFKKVHSFLKTFILIWLTLGGFVVMYGQTTLLPSPIGVDEFGVKEGLSQGMINCIFQDKEGFIWIATKDGLNRYDGYSILTFRHNANDRFSLPDNYCNTITEDDHGNLWIGTNTKGLFLYDKTTERFYNVPEINKNPMNLCVRELRHDKGELFLSTLNGVIILDIKKMALYRDKRDVHNTIVDFDFNKTDLSKSLKADANFSPYAIWSWIPGKALWLSMNKHVYKFDLSDVTSSWQSQSIPTSLFGIKESSQARIYFFPASENSDHMIIASNNTITRFNTKSGSVISMDIISGIEEITPIKYVQLKNGNIYCISESRIYIHDPQKRETNIVTVENLANPYCSIIALFIDANGIQWLGSNGCGIIKRDPQKLRFRSYKYAHTKSVFSKLPSSIIPTISPNMDQLKGNNSIALDKNNTYWILSIPNNGTVNTSLYSNNTVTGRVVHHKKFPFEVNGFAIYIDPNDNLWCGYQNKLKKNIIARIDKKNGEVIKSYEIPDCIDLPEPYVSQCYMDERGILWLATINGLYSFAEKYNKWNHWKNEPNNINSISGDGVLCICPDPALPDKYLWIGTEGAGINRFEKATGHCTHYDESNGLPNNVAYGILSDDSQKLWISTNKGLCAFDPAKHTFTNFTEDDGLPGNEFNRYSALKMQNGDLMFGGVNGFVLFNPAKVLLKQPAAPIVFTAASIFNKTINWPKDSMNLTSPITYAGELTLNPGENIFSISFATLEFRDNRKKMYTYKLDGFDKTWSRPGSKNEVSYTNLNPGQYTFYVKGANTDGEWNHRAIGLSIIVKPYWYQTLVFKISILLFLAFLMYLFYRYRLQQELQIEKLRNRIARDLHDEIGSTLSSISLYAAVAKKVTAENEKAEKILSKINAGTSEMMEAMSDIVWAVNTGSGLVYDLANRLRSFAVELTEAQHLELLFTENQDLPNLALNMEQRKNIYLICKEAISNAVKYAECTKLEVKMSYENRQFHIHIQDNGKSFDPDQSGHSLGGNGIKNMRHRASEINAVLEIITHKGAGTSIQLIVPVKRV